MKERKNKTLYLILKMLWLKILHPTATLMFNITNVKDIENDVETLGYWFDNPKYVKYQYGAICIEIEYKK